MRYTFVTIFLFSFFSLFAQEGEEYYEEEYEDEISRVHFVEANFSIYAPLDAFSEKIEKNTLFGFSFAYLMQLQLEKPSFIGVEVFHTKLGGYSTIYDAIVGNEQLELTGRVSSNALGFNLIYRYYTPIKYGRFETYFEGQLGGKWMYSYLSEVGSFIDDEPYDNFEFLTGEVVLTYGGAFGVQVHISDVYYLNLKSTYHFAISGEYQRRLLETPGFIEFPQQAFETVQSSTNMAKFDVGFTALF